MRARVIGTPRPEVLSALTGAMAVLDAELIESDGGVLAGAVLAAARQRCLVVLLTDLNQAAVTEGLLPRLGLLAARHRLLLAAVADPRLDELAAGAAGRGRPCTRRPRPSGPGQSAPGWRRCCAAAAWTWSTPRRTGWRPRWPTPTSA